MKNVWKLVGTLALATMLAACSTTEEKATSEEKAVSEGTTTYPLTIVDAIGNEVTIEDEPDRIISLAPSNTEILYALGLEDQIVGLTTNDNYPQQVKEKPTVGDMNFNAEEIIALEPDLVLLHESSMNNAEAIFEQLTAMDIDYYVVEDALNFDETYETFETIGQLTNKEEEAENLVEQVKTKVDQVVATVEGQEQKKAFIVVGTVPDIYVVGQNTYMNEMLRILNIENAVKENDWPMYSPEDFVAANPDSIIFTYGGDDDAIKANTAFKDMTAVKNNALILVDGDTTSRQGPRIGEGLEEIAKAIYPDAFAK